MVDRSSMKECVSLKQHALHMLSTTNWIGFNLFERNISVHVQLPKLDRAVDEGDFQRHFIVNCGEEGEPGRFSSKLMIIISSLSTTTIVISEISEYVSGREIMDRVVDANICYVRVSRRTVCTNFSVARSSARHPSLIRLTCWLIFILNCRPHATDRPPWHSSWRSIRLRHWIERAVVRTNRPSICLWLWPHRAGRAANSSEAGHACVSGS